MRHELHLGKEDAKNAAEKYARENRCWVSVPQYKCIERNHLKFSYIHPELKKDLNSVPEILSGYEVIGNNDCTLHGFFLFVDKPKPKAETEKG